MQDDDGYDAVSGQRRLPRHRRWRSPAYWIALVICVVIAIVLISTVGGAWFFLPLAAWVLIGYLIDRRLLAASPDA